jgi:hypothetical protein
MSGVGGVGGGRTWNPISGQYEAVKVPEEAAPEAPVVRGGAPAATAAPAAATRAALTKPADAKLEALKDAMRTESAEKLTKTLEAARKEDPVRYRSALREVLPELVGDRSKLMLHNMAMDANNDGWLTFREAFKTMHDMGFHPVRAFLLSGLTALALAPQTNSERRFQVKVSESDKSERAMFRNAFDNAEELEGRLDEVMSYDSNKDGFVTLPDLERMVEKRVSTMDSKLAAKALGYLNKGEWEALLKLTGGKLSRDELRDFYKGPLFWSFLESDNLAKKLVAYRGGKV